MNKEVSETEGGTMVAPGLAAGGSSFVVNKNSSKTTPTIVRTTHNTQLVKDNFFWNLFKKHTYLAVILFIIGDALVFKIIWSFMHPFFLYNHEDQLDISILAMNGLRLDDFNGDANMTRSFVGFTLMLAILITTWSYLGSVSDKHLGTGNWKSKYNFGLGIMIISLIASTMGPIAYEAIKHRGDTKTPESITQQWAKARYGIDLAIDKDSPIELDVIKKLKIENGMKVTHLYNDMTNNIILSMKNDAENRIYLYDIGTLKELPLTTVAK